jgi:hypothetical protein
MARIACSVSQRSGLRPSLRRRRRNAPIAVATMALLSFTSTLVYPQPSATVCHAPRENVNAVSTNGQVLSVFAESRRGEPAQISRPTGARGMENRDACWGGWEASGGLGKATDGGDRHRGERLLVEHASHCKASSGHAKTYYCWHDLTSGLTAFPASIGTLQHAQISATQRVQHRPPLLPCLGRGNRPDHGAWWIPSPGARAFRSRKPQQLRTIVLAGNELITSSTRFSSWRKGARSLRPCARPSCRSGSQQHRQKLPANDGLANQGSLAGDDMLVRE